MAPHSSILPGKLNGQRSLMGYSSWGLKELEVTQHAHTKGVERSKLEMHVGFLLHCLTRVLDRLTRGERKHCCCLRMEAIFCCDYLSILYCFHCQT